MKPHRSGSELPKAPCTKPGQKSPDEISQGAAMQNAMERLCILRDLHREILSLRSPEEIAAIALERIRKIVACLRASVVLFDFDHELATVLAVKEDTPSSLTAGSHIPLKGVRIIPELYLGRVDIVEDVAQPEAASLITDYLQHDGAKTGIRAFVKVPLIVSRQLIGTLNLWMTASQTLSGEQIETAQEVANSLAVAIENARLFKSVNQHRKELQALATRLTEIEEAERKRLARELHDQVGPNLTALSINLRYLKECEALCENAAQHRRLDDTVRLLHEIATCIRDVMGELRPPMLDDFGLKATLEWFGKQFSERTGLQLKITGEAPAPRLPSAIETALFRIAQEALTNIAKHAGATNVEIVLQTSASRVRLEIIDDGCGFAMNLHAQDKCRTGWGLTTMRERMAGLGGILRIESIIAKGTRVIAEIDPTQQEGKND